MQESNQDTQQLENQPQQNDEQGQQNQRHGKQDNRDNKRHHKNFQQKKERRFRFTYPENWKDDIRKNTTVETVVPSGPSKADLIERPDGRNLWDKINKLEKQISTKFNHIRDINKELRSINQTRDQKNQAIRGELKKLKQEKKGYYDELEVFNKRKNELAAEMTKIETKKMNLSKKSYKGKLWDKKTLLKIIEEKEEQFRDTKKTAQTEKTFNEELSKMKSSLKIQPQIDELTEKRKDLKAKLNIEKQQIRDKYKEINKVKEEMGKCIAKLDENNKEIEKQKQEQEQEVDAEGKPVKKQRPKSQKELELESQKQKILEEIGNLKERKSSLKNQHEENMLSYEKQQFEIRKNEFQLKIKKDLLRDQRRKKMKEEEEERRKEEEKLEKEKLKFKYQKEIDLCQNLINDLKDLKPKEKKEGDDQVQQDKQIDESNLKDKNLKVLKSKRDVDVGGVKPGKKFKKRNRKKQKKQEINDESKLQINIYQIQQFDSLKVMPPQTYGQIDDSINSLQEKLKFFEEKRQQEIDQAEKEVPKEEEQQEETQEDNNQENQKPKEKKKTSQKKKQIELDNAEEFPEL